MSIEPSFKDMANASVLGSALKVKECECGGVMRLGYQITSDVSLTSVGVFFVGMYICGRSGCNRVEEVKRD